MFISDEIIEQVRSRADIVEVLKEYITLKKVGRNYKCLCPFHNEKTPSFIVSPEKQIFHCFGCGEGGNVFNFLMKIESLTFFEAVKKLAVKTGVSLPSTNRYGDFSKENKQRENLYNLNEYVATYYHKFLIESERALKAREYLKKRGASQEVIKEFKIGYATKGNSLLNIAKQKGHSLDFLKRAGLVSFQMENQQPYDYFQDRIIFPIYNPQGQVVAFGGRVINEDRKPKYLNSPETLIYNKSKILYGLNLATSAIRSLNQAIILEGYIDLLTAHQYGVKNAVATLGTALTLEHIHLLKRYSEEVLINYDADSGGVSATLRGLDLLIDSGLRVKVVSLPPNKDPDDFLRENGKDAFTERLNKALPLIEYRFNLAVTNADINTTEGKIFVVKEVLPTISRINNAIEQREEIRKLSQRLFIDEESLVIELGKIKNKNSSESTLREIVSKDISGIEKAQRELVQLMLTDYSLIERIKRELIPSDFNIGDLSILVEQIYRLFPYEGEDFPARIMDSLQNDTLNQIVSQFILEEKSYPEKEKIVDGLIKTIKRHNLKQRYSRLEKEIKSILEKDQQPPIAKLQEYKELIQILKGSRRD